MKAYSFYDCNGECGEDYREYDISGEDYRSFWKACEAHCDTVSFAIEEPECELAKELEKFRIEHPAHISFDHGRFSFGEQALYRNRIRYYRLCPELVELILLKTGSVFELLKGWGFDNPEDPVFYRPDGSVFLLSLIHEGELTLYVKNGEDLSDLLSIDGWLREDKWLRLLEEY